MSIWLCSWWQMALHYTFFPMNDELPTHAICILKVGITKGSKTSGAVLLSPFKCRILYKDGAFIAYIFDSPWPKHNRGSQIWEIILVVRKKAEKRLADAWILVSHRQDDRKKITILDLIFHYEGLFHFKNLKVFLSYRKTVKRIPIFEIISFIQHYVEDKLLLFYKQWLYRRPINIKLWQRHIIYWIFSLARNSTRL